MEELIRGHFRWNAETGKFESFTPVAEPVRTHFVITDEMPPTFSHADEKYYTSKRKMRSAYKALGFVEIGRKPKWKPPERLKPDTEGIRDTVAQAYNDIKYGNAELTELEKEQCKREQRALDQEIKRRKGKI